MPYGFEGGYEGIPIYENSEENINEIYEWCDIAVAHLGAWGDALRGCRMQNKWLIYYLHNTYINAYMDRPENNGITGRKWLKVVYNAHYARKEMDYINRSNVCWPIPDIDKFKRLKKKGNCVVQLGLNANKGGEIFYNLAEKLPEIKFIGVEGYGKNIQKAGKNVTIINNTPDIMEVFKQAKVVLMPSAYESFGRVAAECCAMGIPLIATQTPGLKECLGGDWPLFAARNDINKWEGLINALMQDSKYYLEMCKFAKQRGDKLKNISTRHVNRFETILKYHYESYNHEKG